MKTIAQTLETKARTSYEARILRAVRRMDARAAEITLSFVERFAPPEKAAPALSVIRSGRA